jgi:hypothetical protein
MHIYDRSIVGRVIPITRRLASPVSTRAAYWKPKVQPTFGFQKIYNTWLRCPKNRPDESKGSGRWHWRIGVMASLDERNARFSTLAKGAHASRD